jgi:cytochrome P450 family 135
MSPPAPLPPGPGRPQAWQMLRYQREPLAFIEACARRYGPVFTLRLPFLGTSVAAVDPVDVKTILTRVPERFPDESGHSPLTPMVGESATMFVTGEAHRHQRRTLLGVFSGGVSARWGEAVARIAETEIASLPTGEPVALLPTARRIAFGVISRAVLGEIDPVRHLRMREEVGRSDDPRLALMLLFPTLWQRGGRLNPGRTLRRRRDRLNRLLFDEIARRRALTGEDDRRDNVLSLLVAATHPDGQPLSDVEIRDQLVGLVILGHEITSAGIAWPLERLSRVPAARDRLEAELAAGDEEYLEAVVQETLRVRSPILDGPRTPTEPIELGGHRIPPGVVVSAMCAVAQRRADVWEDPLAFRPERFLGERPAPYAFTPYGGGVRRCIAAPLTMLLMQTVVRLVVERARVTAAPGPDERSRLYGLILLPSRGGRVVLLPRRAHVRAGRRSGGSRIRTCVGRANGFTARLL